MMTFLMAAYLVVAIFAVCMTYCEQKRAGNRSFLFDLLGYLACVVWPATLTVLLVAVRRQAA
ncbi:hypothetical protein [Puniceibacterium sp. IMCC21224]|uniref:hypothetical protein n=1 Tax=Puniceibacterium sp. IMCC21224 TaxID=1618204 RepID=UPI00065D438A|nr:hypothetical protein [Puniceibacterium sp. IMCC21224]KMK63838.1 hypothetical protein IMCC21224_1825 [Puniceibacterium sp. IMCC21224]